MAADELEKQIQNAGLSDWLEIHQGKSGEVQLKTILPIASGFLLLQGIAEFIRCIICLKNGEWPARMHDVEEMEKVLVEQHRKEEAERAAREAAEKEEAAK